MSNLPRSPAATTASLAFQNRACTQCGQPSPENTCHRCREGQAEFAAMKIGNDLRALVNGTGIFSALSVQQRADLLAGLGMTPHTVAPLMSDASLIAVVADERSSESAIDVATAELLRRVDAMAGGAPHALERQRIELEDEQQHRELTLARDCKEEADRRDGAA